MKKIFKACAQAIVGTVAVFLAAAILVSAIAATWLAWRHRDAWLPTAKAAIITDANGNRSTPK